jgi:hypothetical protein
MAFNKNGIFHTTTLDATKTTDTTISNVGQKRTFAQYQDREVLAHVTNRNDFQRPSVQDNCYPTLQAGEINDTSSRLDSDYSQRKALALTPGPTSNPRLALAHPDYGLPKSLIVNLAKLGISSIYPWQSECLLKSGALRGDRNLVYTAPTGGGKSLVADVLMLKKVIESPEAKALLVLPYVALVQEKLRWLRRVVEGVTKNVLPNQDEQRQSVWRKRGDEDHVRVVGFFGGSKSTATWADMDIAVCTVEKVSFRKVLTLSVQVDC